MNLDSIRHLFEEITQRGAFLGNPLDRWALAALTAVITFLVLGIVDRQAQKRVEHFAPGTMGHFICTVLGSIRSFPALLIGIGLGATWLSLPAPWNKVVRFLALIGGGYQAGLMLSHAVAETVERETERRRAKNQIGLASLGIVRLLGQFVVWSVVLLMVLTNLGVDVTGLVASLGVGGIAVALAAQNVLGDLFASLSIVLDRPFEVGDFIVTGDVVGSVQKIGVKTTRIKAISGEEIIVGNGDILGSRVRNFKRMPERRVVLRFGVLYGSKPEALRDAPALCRQAVERHQPHTRFDRAHLDGFSSSSVDFEMVYYVASSDYLLHQDVKQAILLELFQTFPSIGLEFAFPTQTVHVASLPERSASAPR